MKHAATKNSRRRRGLTVIELLLALTVTAMISLAIASMLFAVSYGTDSRNDMRALLLRQRLITARLNALIRSSRMVLAKGSNYIVLWTFDANQNDVPNRSEIRYVELNTTTKELWEYKTVWPGTMTTEQIVAADTEYALTSAFGTVIPALKSQSTYPGERWATGVTGWVLSVNNTDTQAATLISYRFALQLSSSTDFVIGAAALRNNTAVAGN
ncbi:MAG: hypothetical protein K8S99_05890 [Planctomycetes bacterium]|nr:hypothetical protein [Planctomycetota bacterium]